MKGRLVLWADAMAAVVRRDAIVFASYRGRFLTQLLSLVFNLWLFHFLSQLIRVPAFSSPGSYFAYVVVGLVILQVLISTLALAPTTLRQELVSGTFEPIVLSPFGPVWGTVALLLFPLAMSMVTATLMLLFAVAIFGLGLAPTAPLALPVAVLCSVAFMPFGLLLCAATVAVKQLLSGAQFVVAGLSIVAGLYFPVALLPDWIRWASEVQPFTPAADVLRHLLAGTPTHESVAVNLLKLVGFAAVGMPVALYALSRAIAFSRQRGTIIEY